jgi:hypothetical protein
MRTICAADLPPLPHPKWAGMVTNMIEHPEVPLLRYTLSQLYLRYAMPEVADRLYSEGEALVHTTPADRYWRGLERIRRDDIRGWTDYNERWNDILLCSINWYPKFFRWNQWDGRADISTKTLIVSCEQGFGDCILMMRYLQWAKSKCARLVVLMFPSLLSYMRSEYPDIEFISLADEWPAFDTFIHIMSLPAACGAYLPPTSVRWVPQAVPWYGLCWRGGVTQHNDLGREMPVMFANRLIDQTEAVAAPFWFGLVHELDPREVLNPALMQCGPFPSWDVTVERLLSLDRFITTDTGVAHLAGSLGVPTYLLLPTSGAHLWGRTNRTIWYPSVEIIRQTQWRDWGWVIDRVVDKLNEGLNG